MGFVLVDTPRPHVTRITLNRPERMNAMAFDVMIPLRQALEAASADNDTRVVVLTGAGGAFCSGADLEDAGVIPNIAGLTRTTIAQRSMELLDDVIRALRKMHQPVIGAVNGPAIGGGFCLAVATDIRVASHDAYFRAAGVNNGLTSSELGLSYLLPRAVGSSRAFDIMLTGRDVEAAEADRIGLVSRLVPPDELLDAAYDAGRAHHRLLPGGHRAHQAPAVGESRRGQPARPHGPRGHHPAVRAAHHRQLRGGRAGPARTEGSRLPRLTECAGLLGMAGVTAAVAPPAPALPACSDCAWRRSE